MFIEVHNDEKWFSLFVLSQIKAFFPFQAHVECVVSGNTLQSVYNYGFQKRLLKIWQRVRVSTGRYFLKQHNPNYCQYFPICRCYCNSFLSHYYCFLLSSTFIFLLLCLMSFAKLQLFLHFRCYQDCALQLFYGHHDQSTYIPTICNQTHVPNIKVSLRQPCYQSVLSA